MFHPKVSIIIPVYNGCNYLSEAIESALNQTYDNIEILVINDGSNDNGETEKVALSFGDKINYIYKENGGVATALNLGIEKASGDYISWLSHDDLYYPNKIEEQIKLLEGLENKNIIIFNDYELINENSKIIKPIKTPKHDGSIFLNLITAKFVFNGCTLLIPKKIFLDIGYFDKKLKTTQDYNMWLRMMKGGYKFINLPKILTKYRIHQNQDSIAKKELFYSEIKTSQKDIFEMFTLDEIKEKSGLNINKFYIFFYIKLIYIRQNLIALITIFIQKIGLYKIVSPIYRKIFS